METVRLGRTDLEVSRLCLGSMTWGRQNTEAEGHAQLDRGLAEGINFIDTAEMYAIPPTAETYGRTETIIGNWLAARGGRHRLVIATKIAGPGQPWVRGGRNRHDAANIAQAVEASLKRLQTDYIDLYQLHWPDRRVNSFGQLDYRHDPAAPMTHPAEALAALADQVKAGRIRYVGLSNETPWGLMTFIKLAEMAGLPRVASIQNAYSLLNRSFEVGLAECAIREDCGLLAYSPLAGGTLTGKYLGGRIPPGSRRAIDHRKSRYDTPRGDQAAAAYVALAAKHGVDAAQMAIGFVLRQPFVTAAIIGATSMEQLETDLAAPGVALSPELLAELDALHRDNPNPCP